MLNFKEISEFAEEGEILWGTAVSEGWERLLERGVQGQGAPEVCSRQDKGRREGPSLPSSRSNQEVGDQRGRREGGDQRTLEPGSPQP